MTREQQRPAPNPAEMYEDMLVQFVFAPLAERILEAASPAPDDRVLDVATGTGIVLRKCADQTNGRVQLTGIDMNPAMLAVGSSIAEANDLPVTWHEADATRLPVPDNSFDWVFCQHGLQFFPDQRSALIEFRRVLDEGGRAVVAVWQGLDQHPFAEIINDAGYQLVGTNILEVPFSLGSPETLENLLSDAGFQRVTVNSVSVTAQTAEPDRALRMFVAGGTAAIPELQGLDDAERANLIDGIVERAQPSLRRFVSNGELIVDWNANVAIAVK